MKKFWIVIPILLGLFILIWVLWPKESDPRKLLAEADTLTEQNLCLTYLLQQDADDTESRLQLLQNYGALGADPLVIEASRKGLEFSYDGEVQPEEAGEICGVGGIVHKGRKMTDYEGCASVATDGETVYLAKGDGIYAVWHGLEVQLTAARAERMIAAENGLYYLNATARRVQYVARDGHKTETLSPVSALDFAFFQDQLYILGRDGKLYCGGVAVEAPPLSELCAAGNALYGVCDEGLWQMGQGIALPSPVRGLAEGDGRLYYVDANGYPARFDPMFKEAVILAEKNAAAVGFDGRPYYLNQAGDVKKLKDVQS